MEETQEPIQEERRGLRRWGRALAFGLSGLVLGGMLAFTLSAGAAEPSGTSGSGATSQSTTQSPNRGNQGQPCPDRAGGGGAPSQGTPQY